MLKVTAIQQHTPINQADIITIWNKTYYQTIFMTFFISDAAPFKLVQVQMIYLIEHLAEVARGLKLIGRLLFQALVQNIIYRLFHELSR
jgi:hypothetical protein